MKSISTIIASILMLLIVLTLAGTAYLYISGALTGKTSTAFEIMDSYQDTITIRNSGTGPITSFRSVKIDNNDAVYLVTKPDSSLVGYWKFDDFVYEATLQDFYPNYPGWSDSRTSVCGSQGLMGGFNLFGIGASTSKTINLPEGRYRISFTWAKIDTWDGESGRLYYNGNLIWSKSYTWAMGSQTWCGDANLDLFDRISVEFSHTGGSATFKFDSTLDEGAGNEAWGIDNIVIIKTEISDSSGKGNTGTFNGETFNDGTLVNGPAFADGKFGKALQFDGNDDYVNVGIDSSLNFGSVLTVSAWVYQDVSLFDRAIFGSVSSGEPRRIFFRTNAFTVQPNLQSFVEAYVNPANPNEPIPAGWHHMAGTYDGANIRMYVDGTLTDTKALSGSLDIATDNRIGVHPSNSWFMKGVVDEVRVYNRALSQSEIQEDMNSAYPVDRTVAWYNFENDAIDRHNIVKGKYGSAFSFDSVNDYVETVDKVLFSNEFTIESWFKPWWNKGTIPGQIGEKMEVILSKWTRINNAVDYGYRFERIYDSDYFGIVISSGIDTSGISTTVNINTIPEGNWHHAVATFKGNNFLRLYIDGDKVAESTTGIYASVTDASARTHRIGMFSDGYGRFNGTIDEVKIYNRALSESEVKASYNIGSQINPGEAATIKIYNQLSKGTHTVRLCTSSMCNTGYLTTT